MYLLYLQFYSDLAFFFHRENFELQIVFALLAIGNLEIREN